VTDVVKGIQDGPTLSAGQVAKLVGGRIEGDPSVQVRGIAPLSQARADDLGFLTTPRYLRDFDGTEAGALLVSQALAAAVETHPSRVVVEDPRQAVLPLLAHFFPDAPPEPGIHPTAVLGKGVALGRELTIGPYAVIGDGTSLGDGVRLGAHSVVGENCVVGNQSVLHPHVVLYPNTVLGSRVVLHAGVRIGADGFGYVPAGGGIRKVPQVGACVIGDDVEVGANSCIDRGSIGRTEIGASTKIDNLVQVGHNVRVGRSVLMAAQAGIGGSIDIGDGAMIGGQAGLAGHLDIGPGAKLAAQAGVIGDVPAGRTVAGFPARENREFLRATANLYKLPDALKRVKDLEERLARLEESEEA
jgi:UDP-3-O-[3-hydroxymyristoyl] glucosamine N-acyltransferase